MLKAIFSAILKLARLPLIQGSHRKMRLAPYLYVLYVAICGALLPNTAATYTSQDSSENSKVLFNAISSASGVGESNRERHQQSDDSPHPPYANPYPYPYALPPGNGVTGNYQSRLLPFNAGFAISHGFVPGDYHNGPPPHNGGLPLPAIAAGFHNGPHSAPYEPMPNSQPPTGGYGDTECPTAGCPLPGRQPADYPRPPLKPTDPAVSGAGLLDVRSGAPGNYNNAPEHRPGAIEGSPAPGHGVHGYYPAGGVPMSFPPYYLPPPQYPRPPVAGGFARAGSAGGHPPSHPGVRGHSPAQYPNVDDYEHVQPSHHSHGRRGHSSLDHKLKSNTEYTETGHHVGPFQGPALNGYGYNVAFNRPSF